MQHNKIKLIIDDYGELSKELDDIIKCAQGLGVRYEKQCLQTWYQIEPISKKNLSKDYLKEIFHNCNFKTCIGMTNGRFYHCNVAGHMNTIGLVNDEDSNYIALENEEWDMNALRDEIRELLSVDCLKACDWCGYCRNIEIPVAEQIT